MSAAAAFFQSAHALLGMDNRQARFTWAGGLTEGRGKLEERRVYLLRQIKRPHFLAAFPWDDLPESVRDQLEGLLS